MYINSRFYCTKHFVFDKESPDDEIRYPVTLVQYFDLDNKPLFNDVVFGEYVFEKTMFPTYRIEVSYNELSHLELIQSIRRWRKRPLKNSIRTNFFAKFPR